MEQYLDLLKETLNYGEKRSDRTGTGTISLFGLQRSYDLRDGFPLVTTKKVFTKGIIYELLWMLKGDTNIKYLNENGVHIWDDWAKPSGDLGRIYGKQWRDWSINSKLKVDQIESVIDMIKFNPGSRRLIVSAWNVGEIHMMALPPCHCFFQFYVSESGYLDLKLYQRSADLFLGVPFNIASYSILLSMVAQVCGLKPRRFIHTIGDGHIYLNHVEQVKEQLSRKPFARPKLELNPNVRNIFDFKYEDIKIVDYMCYPAIKGEVAV
ncbi:thymidylate synthase [Bacteroides fragilis]|nr:thymidylate synthase [Bacteroides fragilis]